MPKSSFKKMEAAFEPILEFNNLLAGTMEEAFNLQVESAQGYAKLGIDNINAGFKIRSVDDMMSYAESQKELAQKTSDMMIADAKSYSELGAKFVDSLRSMVESNMKTSVAAATDAVKASA